MNEITKVTLKCKVFVTNVLKKRLLEAVVAASKKKLNLELYSHVINKRGFVSCLNSNATQFIFRKKKDKKIFAMEKETFCFFHVTFSS